MKYEPYYRFKERIKPYLKLRKSISLIINIGGGGWLNSVSHKIAQCSRAVEQMPTADQVNFLEDLQDAVSEPLVSEEDKINIQAEVSDLFGRKVNTLRGTSLFFILTPDRKTLGCMLEMPKQISNDSIGSAAFGPHFLFELQATKAKELEPFKEFLPSKGIRIPTSITGKKATLYLLI